MACTSANAACSSLLHHVGSLSDSASCIHHIVHDDYILILHVTDNLNALYYVSTSTCLVTEHQWAGEIVGKCLCTLSATSIRAGNYRALKIETCEIRKQYTRTVEVIHRYVKESLNLISMQIHGNQTVDTCNAEEVSNEFRSDAYTWLVLPVLTCPSEVRHYSIDLSCRSTLCCINHQEELHEIVRVWECTLHEEYVASANTFFVRYCKLSIRELGNLQLTEWTTEACTYLFCKIFCCSA